MWERQLETTDSALMIYWRPYLMQAVYWAVGHYSAVEVLLVNLGAPYQQEDDFLNSSVRNYSVY